MLLLHCLRPMPSRRGDADDREWVGRERIRMRSDARGSTDEVAPGFEFDHSVPQHDCPPRHASERSAEKLFAIASSTFEAG
jgi:hypothetical protein